MNHSGGEAHAYLYTPTVLISWFSSLLLLPLTPNLRIQRLLPLCRSAAKCSHHSHNQTHPPPQTPLFLTVHTNNEAGILCYIAN